MATVHHHPHYRTGKLIRLRIALLLTVFGTVIEFVGGFLSNSLALLSDAGHMLTHVFALGMSYFAILLSLRPLTKKRTFGFYRAEVLAAFINGIVLIFISAYFVYEAVLRFVSPRPIRIQEMIFVTLIGLVINGVSTFLLARIDIHDLNTRSAFLHEIGDLISSIAVLAAGVIIFYTRNYIIDPLLALFICVLIVIWAVKLIIESANILLEATPRHLDIDELIATVKREIAGIHEIHHVHVWTIASSLYALTAHIVIEDCHISKANDLLHSINKLLKDRFRIEHTNIQFECLLKEKED